MNDYLDITASELLKELDHFFLIDTHDGAQTGFWVIGITGLMAIIKLKS